MNNMIYFWFEIFGETVAVLSNKMCQPENKGLNLEQQHFI